VISEETLNLEIPNKRWIAMDFCTLPKIPLSKTILEKYFTMKITPLKTFQNTYWLPVFFKVLKLKISSHCLYSCKHRAQMKQRTTTIFL